MPPVPLLERLVRIALAMDVMPTIRHRYPIGLRVQQHVHPLGRVRQRRIDGGGMRVDEIGPLRVRQPQRPAAALAEMPVSGSAPDRSGRILGVACRRSTEGNVDIARPRVEVPSSDERDPMGQSGRNRSCSRTTRPYSADSKALMQVISDKSVPAVFGTAGRCATHSSKNLRTFR